MCPFFSDFNLAPFKTLHEGIKNLHVEKKLGAKNDGDKKKKLSGDFCYKYIVL